MKVLYHEATDEQGRQLEVEFLDGNGKLWIVPFGEPTEYENGFMADKILEHQKYMGVVEVKFTKTRTGISYNMPDAVERAQAALLMSEKACINDYVKIQLESRVRQNYPPLPPVGRYLTCVVKHKVNLLKYGLRPVGWEPPYELETGEWDPKVASITSGGTSTDEQIRQMRNMMESQQMLINNLMLAMRGQTRGEGVGGSLSHTQSSDTRSTEGIGMKSSKAAEILASDAHPAPGPRISISEGTEDTVESMLSDGRL